MQKLCCVRTRQHSLTVWIILSQVHHRISTNSQPFLVGIVSGFVPRRELLVELKEPGVYTSALIKKWKYWPEVHQE